ncbi:MAG: triose-phosphate isomerase [Deltaproteobacteria bacterium]|nr:triose-phosphate isomerase [Deltaproteobacteria bacterium]
MRKLMMAANWKMNMSLADLEGYIDTLKKNRNVQSGDRLLETVLAMPYPFLFRARELIRGTRIRLGAQNAHWQERGAFTGEVSIGMLKELGVTEVILGHSERRQQFGEYDEVVAKKVQTCIHHDMRALLCVGETLEERKSGQTFSVVQRQLDAVFSGLADLTKLVIAYEPVWAIGTGVSASSAQAQEVHRFIRDKAKQKFGDAADSLLILYGGSMNLSNVRELVAQPDIDGGLIGGASLDASLFSQMLDAVLS